jgi:hypothetical protein
VIEANEDSGIDISVQAQPAPPQPSSDRFRIVALISAYNEADIIGPVLDHLAEQGVHSYLIDDGSTDDTVEIASRRLGRGLLGIERLDKADATKTAWRAILARKLELSAELGADWYIHHDADEIRESPWPSMTLRDALQWVDRLGFNAVDFRVLNFAPVDDNFRPGDDPRLHFVRWADPAEYDRKQRKCWKAGCPGVRLEDGGHDVRFDDRRLFPIRFLLRHYPIRGQAHGVRKVMHERRGRFVEEEIALGWHRQYDDVATADHAFLRNPASLTPFDLDALRLETLLEPSARPPAEPSRESPTDRRSEVRGVLEHVSNGYIGGWALNFAPTGGVPDVDLWDGGNPIATVRASITRPDLTGKGAGGGFAVQAPRVLLDGRAHWIWATVAGTGVALRRAPLVLQAAGRPPVGSGPDPDQDGVDG